ncbi:MAG: phosphoribosylglycinamide formyltransferase [Phycisphaerae bacterium]
MVPTKPRDRLRLAVLISGTGRTLINLHDRIADGLLDARIIAVVCSRGDTAGVEHARRRGLRTTVVDPRRMSADAFHAGVAEAVAGADLVCMAGFLSLWRVPDVWTGRVINIHPALLPDFGGPGMYGRRVHEAVLAAGKSESGCTVHICDNEYDHGPILLQRTVRVRPDDTPDDLAARVFAEECIAYPDAIRLFCEDRVRVTGGRVIIL